MTYTTTPRPAAALVLASAMLALGGCATRPAPVSLYQWQGYEKNVDTYFRADRDSLSTQTQLMEADLQKIIASGAAAPPGYYAHLGLLYGKQGNAEQLKLQLENEKTRFPESSAFVDFLLRNFKK